MTRPESFDEIPTPALVVDVAAMERNIRRMAEFFAEGPCKLRPHFKAHKTPEIARRQLAAGSCTGLTCATVGEAKLASGFCDDILIANQVIGRDKTDRVAAVTKAASITVAVDSQLGLDQIAKSASDAGTSVGIVVDINVGMPRCGIEPGEAALGLARRIADTASVRLVGVMGYEGHVVGREERMKRESGAGKSMDKLLTTAGMIREDGLACEIVSAGGTGTYDITGRMDGITEIQAGSYVLMDTAYAKLDIPFEQALTVLGTVVSRTSPELCVTDSGHKACTEDHGNPDVKGIEGASVLFLSDEHATITLPSESAVRPGDRIELWPSHIDPTINLHDVLYAVNEDGSVEVWPVSARGYGSGSGAGA